MKELLAQLAQPFEPKHITWKPGATTKDGGKCMAMAYADLRAYQDRLDELMGLDWSVRYTFWGDNRIACELTLYIGDALGRRESITRTSTGEMEAQDEKNGMGGTVAEAQAFKRACAMFGMGRYLYDLPSTWIEFDSAKKKISDAGQKELDARYQQWYTRQAAQKRKAAEEMAQADNVVDVTPTIVEDGNPFEDAPIEKELISPEQLQRLNILGRDYYGVEWDEMRPKLVIAVTTGATDSSKELTPKGADKLIKGIEKRIAERNAQPQFA